MSSVSREDYDRMPGVDPPGLTRDQLLAEIRKHAHVASVHPVGPDTKVLLLVAREDMDADLVARASEMIAQVKKVLDRNGLSHIEPLVVFGMEAVVL